MIAMAEISGGHIVAKYLKEVEKVGAVFSLSGGHIDRIYDGIREFGGPRLIDVRHEQAAAMMAHAWSIYTGKTGVCLVTAGPGFTNALTGLVNAKQENAPMVLISGASPVQDNDKGALQEMIQADMVKSTVKWYAVCRDIKRIPEYLFNAFRQASSGRPGPVYLEIPPDVLNISVMEEAVAWPQKGTRAAKPGPDPTLIQPAADLINQAQKPFLVAGSGVGFSECDQQLRTFIDKSGIPFMLLGTGRGVLADEHPLSLWGGGLMGAVTAFSQADVVIALGVRFNYLLQFGALFPQAKMVRVDIDPTELDRNREAEVGIVGDLCLTLKALNKSIEEGNHSAWRDSLAEAYTPMIQGEIDARDTPSDPIHPIRMVARVREAVGDDAIFVVDGGDTSYYGATGLRAVAKAGVMPTAGGQFGCLGTGIPFAIAAKAALPDKTVILINGDGSFGLNAMEFDTAVRHNLPFVCIVNNDCAWGMIRHGQRIGYGGDDKVIGSELGMRHYEKMVEGLGGYGELVVKDEDIVPAVKRAMASGKPACVNIVTDRDAVSLMTHMFMDGLKVN